MIGFPKKSSKCEGPKVSDVLKRMRTWILTHCQGYGIEFSEEKLESFLRLASLDIDDGEYTWDEYFEAMKLYRKEGHNFFTFENTRQLAINVSAQVKNRILIDRFEAQHGRTPNETDKELIGTTEHENALNEIALMFGVKRKGGKYRGYRNTSKDAPNLVKSLFNGNK